jgi:HAD superfamily hydrolase (TIGR01490 family)
MRDLALFDFDGTITTSDTFTPFVMRAVPRGRLAWGTALLSPLILGYKLGLVSATRMRQSIVRVGFRGRRADAVRELGAGYAATHLGGVVRAHALERIVWHQQRGDDIVVVSASLDVYLSGWCRKVGVDLIGTELEERDGILTGRYVEGDCSGDEKARRVRKRYDLDRYRAVYAYGDTPEDEAMLALATRRYFRWRERGAVT